MSKNRYWVSWYQPTEDYRPLTHPPSKLLGWWCSGYNCEDDKAIIVVLLDADDEKQAKEILKEYWPETKNIAWRFFSIKENNFIPNNRFPLSEWSSLNKPREAQNIVDNHGDCVHWDFCFVDKAPQGDPVLLEEQFCFECNSYQTKG